MKVFRGVSLFLFVMVVGVVAEAGCMRCFREPGKPLTQGTCGYDFEADYCDRMCCGGYIGDPCSIPDFIDPCDTWLVKSKAGAAAPVQRAVLRPDLFSTRALIEQRTAAMHRRLQKLDPGAPKCGART